MKSMILGMLAETYIHPGSGQTTGFVDLPVAREAATDYPVIVGSSMKGALNDQARKLGDEKYENDYKTLFGEQNNAGSILVSDARLLLLPVRCLTSHFKWITCKYLIERYMRDRQRGGLSVEEVITDVEEHHYMGKKNDTLFLEEREFTYKGDLPTNLIKIIKPLIQNDSVKKRMPDQLVVLNDNDFAWFARYGLAINARNELDKNNKTSKNLWYEETLPPESLFYCILLERSSGALTKIPDLFKDSPYLQAGGNETIGQGWFAIQEVKGE